MIDDLILVFGTLFNRQQIESLIDEVQSDIDIILRNSADIGEGEGGVSCSSSSSSSSRTEQEKEHDNDDADNDNGISSFTNMYTGDRHAKGILDTVDDYDCLEREFDVMSNENEEFDVNEAREVLLKCRLLVIRNVFTKETIDKVLPKYIQYINDIDEGRINSKGTTSFGGDYFILKEDNYRYNYMLTKELIEKSSNMLANEIIIDILSHPKILGEQMILNHAGTINAYAQPTTSPNNQKAYQNKAYQYWHIDGEYVPNQNTEHDFHTTIGVGGHDISSYAINMFTPINMNITSTTQGPTEFCLGTSHLRGHDMEIDFPVQTQNLDLLKQKNGIVETLQEFEWYVENGLYNNAVCPSELLRIPKLNQGDVVLFDYMVTHRGGSNNSNKLRSILFAMYSRKWYRDTTFDTPQNNGYDTNDTNNPNEETETEIELDHLMKLTRFAIIDREKNK